MSVEIAVVRDAAEAAERAAALLVDLAHSGGVVALAGGSTPRAAYALAAAAEPDWSRVDVWYGDDRIVPADDERSNQHLVATSLLPGLEAPPVLHPIRPGLTPDEAAAAYDSELKGVRLDLVLLGLGADGHTASLFPGNPALSVTNRRAVATAPGLAPWVDRVTMTIPMLASGKHGVFLAVGADKAEPARRAFGEPPSQATPASLVRSAAGRTTVILDEAAASQL